MYIENVPITTDPVFQYASTPNLAYLLRIMQKQVSLHNSYPAVHQAERDMVRSVSGNPGRCQLKLTFLVELSHTWKHSDLGRTLAHTRRQRNVQV
ncbi:hypothetical protein BaRGS_00033557 [Batillaria attramentaria]|uniref:Uncharacterized protein n=1 Tax=Batillaria attramentaria TaxID=370345 RepID=A0ABD0JKH4_9CAEN